VFYTSNKFSVTYPVLAKRMIVTNRNNRTSFLSDDEAGVGEILEIIQQQVSKLLPGHLVQFTTEDEGGTEIMYELDGKTSSALTKFLQAPNMTRNFEACEIAKWLFFERE